MSEWCESFRVRPLSKPEAERLRPGIHARPARPSALRWTEEHAGDASGTAEWWPLLELHRQLSSAIGGLERPIERLEQGARPELVFGESLEISGAFEFEDIPPDEREQLAQLALRIQSQSLRAQREANP